MGYAHIWLYFYGDDPEYKRRDLFSRYPEVWDVYKGRTLRAFRYVVISWMFDMFGLKNDRVWSGEAAKVISFFNDFLRNCCSESRLASLNNTDVDLTILLSYFISRADPYVMLTYLLNVRGFEDLAEKPYATLVEEVIGTSLDINRVSGNRTQIHRSFIE